MDEAGRILSLEAQLEDVKRTLVAHDFLLRALLTHLALSDPEAFGGLIGGFTQSGLYRADISAGDLTREVAHELTGMLEEVAASVERRR
ncbi:hypothetical protein [Phenylobacterium sp.]|jgi:hypothetical protein|uniref:hypothetical protein n=1 Tax=Phenylobacterium sp. TaxID=1871053 RepID=UPI002F92678D